MKRYLLLLILCIPFVASSKDFLSRNSFIEDYSFVQLQHLNDVPFLFEPKRTNDHAFTASMGLMVSLNNKEQKKLVSFGYTSTLYSSPPLYDVYDGDRLLRAHYFNEINQLFYSTFKYDDSNKIIFKNEVGLGFLNKDRPIPGLMLWFQGGIDGKGGYHKMIDNEGQVNLSQNKRSLYIYYAPSLMKYFYLTPGEAKSPHIYKTELGVNLCTILRGTNVFLRNDFKVQLLKETLFNIIPVEAIITGQADVIAHKDGIKFNPGYGIEVHISRLVMGMSKYVPLGNDNVSWVNYTDNENINRLYFRYKFGR